MAVDFESIKKQYVCIRVIVLGFTVLYIYTNANPKTPSVINIGRKSPVLLACVSIKFYYYLAFE